jgi:hypothetical protein
MSKVLSRTFAIMLMLGGMIILTFFRFTELFARLRGSEDNLGVIDLGREGVCKSVPQALQFARIQGEIRKPEMTTETLTQTNQNLSGLISEVEGPGLQKSAVLRTVRVQIATAMQKSPLREDVSCIARVVQEPNYPSAVRIKIENISAKAGISIGRTKD